MRKIIAITALYLVSLSSMVWAVDCPIPDTGLTKCYDMTQEITCPQQGEDFYGQDAQYSCNPRSYTKLDENGIELSDSATEWVMVRDNVTGLIWEVKTDDGSIHDKDDAYRWQDGHDIFISTLNSQNFGGHNDWRMPNLKELFLILDNSKPTPPTINTDYFPNTYPFFYWSSTDLVINPDQAWLISFYHGGVQSYLKSFGPTGDSYMRAVRPGQCEPFGNFVDNVNGTVTDTSTGLMWQQESAPIAPGSYDYNWQQALSYCENLTLAGYEDWRLPNRNELQTLVDYNKFEPSIDTTIFSITTSPYYWSSTTSGDDPERAWSVDFYRGNSNRNSKTGTKDVRAVRGGCGSPDTSTTTTVAPSTTTSSEISTTTTTTIDGETSTTSTGDIPTTTTTAPSCLSKAIYGEHSKETEFLRYIRDNVLSQTSEGQEIIKLYYEWSPAIGRVVEEDEQFKGETKEMIDSFLELIMEEAE